MAVKVDESVDQAVLDLLVKVEQKKKEIAKAKTRPVWRTSCTFGKDPNSTQDRTNIQTVRDTRKLVEIFAFLNIQQQELRRAADDLNVDFDGNWLSYSISDWKEDIRTRVAQLSIEQKQKEIDILDERVNRLVTPEQRRIMELKALQQILGD